MVHKLTLNAVLTRASLEKDFRAKLISPYSEIRERTWGLYINDLKLDTEEKRDLLDLEPQTLDELMEFCVERFALKISGSPERG